VDTEREAPVRAVILTQTNIKHNNPPYQHVV